MAALQNLRQGVGRLWENLSHEWSQFTDKAAHALTRFTPMKKEEERAGDYELVRYTPRLGVLASEVLEGDKDVIVRLEAPGLDAKDFTIQMAGDSLMVRGEKRMERREQKGHYHVMECAYGSFQRIVPLPTEVDADRSKASYRNGVLNITLPKTTGAETRRIKVDIK